MLHVNTSIGRFLFDPVDSERKFIMKERVGLCSSLSDRHPCTRQEVSCLGISPLRICTLCVWRVSLLQNMILLCKFFVENKGKLNQGNVQPGNRHCAGKVSLDPTLARGSLS